MQTLSKKQKVRTTSSPWPPDKMTLDSVEMDHGGSFLNCTRLKLDWLYSYVSLSPSDREPLEDPLLISNRMDGLFEG